MSCSIQNSRNVHRAAGSECGKRRPVRIGLEPCNQLTRQIRRRHRIARDNDLWGRGNERNRRKILDDVVGQRINGAVDNMRAPNAEAERVSVRRRACDPADANAPRRAAHVLDDDRLTQRHLHVLGDDAGDRVERSAGGGRYDDLNWSRRIDFPRGRTDERGGGGGSERESERPLHHW